MCSGSHQGKSELISLTEGATGLFPHLWTYSRFLPSGGFLRMDIHPEFRRPGALLRAPVSSGGTPGREAAPAGVQAGGPSYRVEWGGTTRKGDGGPELGGWRGGVLGQLQAILESGFQAGDTHRPVAADVSPDSTWRPPPASLRVTVNLIAVSECGFPAVGQAAQHLPPQGRCCQSPPSEQPQVWPLGGA